MQRTSDTKLEYVIRNEQKGAKGWDGEPLSKVVLDLALDLRDAREEVKKADAAGFQVSAELERHRQALTIAVEALKHSDEKHGYCAVIEDALDRIKRIPER